jgi:hypothetical protein
MILNIEEPILSQICDNTVAKMLSCSLGSIRNPRDNERSSNVIEAAIPQGKVRMHEHLMPPQESTSHDMADVERQRRLGYGRKGESARISDRLLSLLFLCSFCICIFHGLCISGDGLLDW